MLTIVMIVTVYLAPMAHAQQFDEQEFDRINSEISTIMFGLEDEQDSKKRAMLIESLKRGLEQLVQLKQRTGNDKGRKYLQDYEGEIRKAIKQAGVKSKTDTDKGKQNTVLVSVKDKTKTLNSKIISNPWKITKIGDRNHRQDKHNEEIRETIFRYFQVPSWAVHEAKYWNEKFVAGGKISQDLQSHIRSRFYDYYQEFEAIYLDVGKVAGTRRKDDPRWVPAKQKVFAAIGRRIAGNSVKYSYLANRKAPRLDAGKAKETKRYLNVAMNKVRGIGSDLLKTVRGTDRRRHWDGYDNFVKLSKQRWSSYQARYYELQNELSVLVHIDVTNNMDAYWAANTKAWDMKRDRICHEIAKLERRIVWALGEPRTDAEFKDELGMVMRLDSAINKREKWSKRSYDNALRTAFAYGYKNSYNASTSMDGGGGAQAQLQIEEFRENYARKMLQQSQSITQSALLSYNAFIGARLERGLARALNEDTFSPHELADISAPERFERSLYKRIRYHKWDAYKKHAKKFFKACFRTESVKDFFSGNQLTRYERNEASRVEARRKMIGRK